MFSSTLELTLGGGLASSPLVLASKISNLLHMIDTNTLQCKLPLPAYRAEVYWRLT